MKPLILAMIMLLSSASLLADDSNLMHITAHFGACYVITHVTEVVCTKVVGSKHKIACTLAGVILANGINIGRKIEQGVPSDTNRAVISGGAGSLAAVIMINF